MSLSKKAFIFVGIILLADQVMKFWVKTNMYLAEKIPVFGDWFNICFTENPGMAFGMLFGGPTGKIILVILRIILTIILIVYIPKIAKKEGITNGLILGIAGICAGALGNIIDSAFYGLIFDTGTAYDPNLGRYVEYIGISKLSQTGYSSFMHGCVVDMLQFPIIKTHYPNWFPFNAGEEFIFFRPIFNIADTAISTSAIYILLFQRKALNILFSKESKSEER
ncbi:MAG: lipoprotein signal peptidase [Prevotellaceae bacterium]|jgi:signal peptidase II|nr:lipoprotein signal peptidase [Prevotellaceae bacterium]